MKTSVGIVTRDNLQTLEFQHLAPPDTVNLAKRTEIWQLFTTVYEFRAIQSNTSATLFSNSHNL